MGVLGSHKHRIRGLWEKSLNILRPLWPPPPKKNAVVLKVGFSFSETDLGLLSQISQLSDRRLLRL